MKCKRSDCFNCPYPDCINDTFKKKPTEEQYKRHMAQVRAYQRKRRLERIEQGLCTECGKNKPTEGYKTCAVCRNFRARRRKENYYKKGDHKPPYLLDGVTLCKKCGKEPPMEGYKVCKRCYESCVANLTKTPSHMKIKQNNGFSEAINTYWNNRQGANQ